MSCSNLILWLPHSSNWLRYLYKPSPTVGVHHLNCISFPHPWEAENTYYTSFIGEDSRPVQISLEKCAKTPVHLTSPSDQPCSSFMHLQQSWISKGPWAHASQPCRVHSVNKMQLGQMNAVLHRGSPFARQLCELLGMPQAHCRCKAGLNCECTFTLFQGG